MTTERGEMERLKREETCVHVRLLHVDVWQKPTQYGNYPSIKNKEKKLVEIPAAKKITTVNMLVVHPSGLFIIGFLT